MSKPRRAVAATQVRIHLGEALRSLEYEDIVIEKGGMPVALLTKYSPFSAASESEVEAEYERARAKAAHPRGAELMDTAMAAGWAGIDAEDLLADVYQWRGEQRVSAYRSWDDDGTEAAPDDDGEVSAGQRYLHPRSEKTQRVADGDGPGYPS